MNAPMIKARSPCGKPGCCGGNGGKTCTCNCGSNCQSDIFVRPQFFAGQLLCEDDLQALETYVLAKNRLHNRRLFGEGIVCGFEVLCHPCGDGRVIVQPGYALDCCGNDIVLSCNSELDINLMIRDLRRDKLGGYDCGDPCAPIKPQTAPAEKTKSPEDVAREYCLYVRYCEQETDPVSPYSPDQPCGPAACEPTRVREGLYFELRCPEAPQAPDDFLAALQCCLKDVIGIEKMSQDALVLEDILVDGWVERALLGQQKKSAADLRDQLLALLDRSPHLTKCKLRDEVLAVKLPKEVDAQDPGQKSNSEKKAFDALVAIFVKLLKDCICNAAIPPCGDCDDTGVLLACIKVKKCEVIEICNLSRRFVLSPAALRYWLSADRIEQWLRQECCAYPPCKKDAPAAPKDAVAPQAETIALLDAGIARDAQIVHAAALAVAAVQPARSPDTIRFAHIVSAFGALAGERAQWAGEAAPGPSIGRRTTIPQVILGMVKDQVVQDLNQRTKEMEDKLVELQAQLNKLANEPRRPARKQSNAGGNANG